MTMAYMSVGHQDLVDGVGADDRRADDAESERLVDLITDGVVDAADDLRHVEDVLRHLCRHDVAIVAVGQGAEGIGLLDPGALEHVLVDAVAQQGIARKVVTQPRKCGSALIDDRHLVALVDQLEGQPGADPAAAHDDDLHEDWIMAESTGPVGFDRACASRFGSWGCCRFYWRSGSVPMSTSTLSATASHWPSSCCRR